MQQGNGRNNAYANAAVYRKICVFCGKEFTCLKSSTLYCSHRCSSLAYKQRKKDERHRVADVLFQENRNSVLMDRLEKMELLSPSMAALYLGMNRTTIYRYMSAGALPSIRIGNSTRIRKSDLDILFCVSMNPWGKNRDEYCTIKESSEEFGIPYSTVYKLFKGACLKPYRKGNVDYYLKAEARDVLSRNKEESHPEITKWYTCKEIQRKYLMTEPAVYSMAYDFDIPKRTAGRTVYYSQKHVDEVKAYGKPGNAVAKKYYTTGSAMEAYGMSEEQVRRLLKQYKIPTKLISRTLHFLRSDFDEIFGIPKFNP